MWLWRTLVPGTSWSKFTVLSAAREEFSPLIFLYVPTLLFREESLAEPKSPGNLQEQALSWALLLVLHQPLALPAVTRGLFHVLNVCLAGLSLWLWRMCCLPCQGIWDTFTNNWVMIELHRQGRAEGGKAEFVLRQRVKLARVWVCSGLAID